MEVTDKEIKNRIAVYKKMRLENPEGAEIMLYNTFYLADLYLEVMVNAISTYEQLNAIPVDDEVT